MLEGLRPALILVVEDVHEISDGIGRLLKADGYRVVLASDELEGIKSAQLTPPDLILMNWRGIIRRSSSCRASHTRAGGGWGSNPRGLLD